MVCYTLVCYHLSVTVYRGLTLTNQINKPHDQWSHFINQTYQSQSGEKWNHFSINKSLRCHSFSSFNEEILSSSMLICSGTPLAHASTPSKDADWSGHQSTGQKRIAWSLARWICMHIVILWVQLLREVRSKLDFVPKYDQFPLSNRLN